MSDFEELYRRYYKQVYFYLLGLSGSEHLAEEITQETFFKVLRKIDTFRGECRKILEVMKQQDFPGVGLSDAAFEQRQVESIQKAKKKLRKRNAAFGGIGIVIGVLAVVVLLRILMLAGVFGFLAWDMKTAPIEVYEETDQYKNYIGGNAVEPYRGKWGMDETIFPEVIADDGTSVTYVMILFCNYFLDLDIREYIPGEYLLQGFDAGKDNPYRESMLGK